MLTSLCLLLVLQDPAPPAAPAPIAERIRTMLGRIQADELAGSVRALVDMGSRHVMAESRPGRPGKPGAVAYLEQRLRACGDGRLQVERQSCTVFSTRLGREVTVTNVVATLPGTQDPERIYVVGGHYDSICSDNRDSETPAPGANDDGSGTAVMLEACRVMARERFAATVVFVAYDGEEMGLLGSTAHAEALAKAGARVDGMITNDIVGNTLGMDGKKRDEYLRVFSYALRGNDSPGRSLARAATHATRSHVPGFELRMVLRGDRYGRGGDHRPFHQQGFPAVRFTEAREDYARQHQTVREQDGKRYGDTPDFVDAAYLARVCAVNVATLAELAAAPPPPASVQASGSRTRYDTLLRWQAVPGAAGYELLARLTTSPDWEVARTVPAAEGQEARATLADVLLDDHVVGVRAIGADGARSRAAVPPEPDAVEQRPAGRRSGG